MKKTQITVLIALLCGLIAPVQYAAGGKLTTYKGYISAVQVYKQHTEGKHSFTVVGVILSKQKGKKKKKGDFIINCRILIKPDSFGYHEMFEVVMAAYTWQKKVTLKCQKNVLLAPGWKAPELRHINLSVKNQ